MLFISSVFSQEKESNLLFPIQKTLDPSQSGNQRFDLGDPSKVEKTIVYDPITRKYIFQEKLNSNSSVNYRNPSMMTLEEYLKYDRKKAELRI